MFNVRFFKRCNIIIFEDFFCSFFDRNHEIVKFYYYLGRFLMFDPCRRVAHWSVSKSLPLCHIREWITWALLEQWVDGEDLLPLQLRMKRVLDVEKLQRRHGSYRIPSCRIFLRSQCFFQVEVLDAIGTWWSSEETASELSAWIQNLSQRRGFALVPCFHAWSISFVSCNCIDIWHLYAFFIILSFDLLLSEP